MSHGPLVGIDLGTTFSLAAVFRDGQPGLVRNPLGAVLTPSAVLVDEQGMVVVGEAARARAITHPGRVALGFKRDMGTPTVYDLGGRSLGPVELSALVIGALKADVEQHLGEPVRQAVISVPAYFGEAQRRATKEAGALAGLDVERLVNEPTAAAIAYGLHARETAARVAVLDLGGGTFDVTVLEIFDGCIEVRSTSGDSRLGGEDCTRLLAMASAERIGGAGWEQLDAPSRARLLSACETVKHQLTSAPEATLSLLGLRAAGAARDVSLTWSRGEAETLFAPLMERMQTCITRALRDADMLPGALDRVLLVGGATRMPCVRDLARRTLGRDPDCSLQPDETVALGAAVQAALRVGDEELGDYVVTDVAPFSLGIETTHGRGGVRVEGLFAPILDRGTVVPASRVKRFSTVSDGQREIEVTVYQGEAALCKGNRRLGQYNVSGIPPDRAGSQDIDVRFTYDPSGLLEVESTVVSTGQKAMLVIEESPGRLDDRQREERLRNLAHLKFHPREALPNVTALARAEAAFMELVGPRRELLAERLAIFRTALEGQDPAEIALQRRILLEVVESLQQR
jgi:molecular chaperone HscC